MLARTSSPLARRVTALSDRAGRHLNASLTIAAIVVGIVAYLVGDRTNWSDGYGYDGRFYGELAGNWASAVFGHGATTPPGIGPLPGPHPTGVDSYYVVRIVPSGVVWAAREVLSLSPTHAHIVLLFALLDAAMLGLVMFSWVASADLLALGRAEKLLGAMTLIVCFAVLRTGTYYPVLTDDTGFALGALSMLLWLRHRTVGLVLCTIVGAFAWPPQLFLGPVLLAFPPPDDPRALLSARPRTLGPRLRRPAPSGLGLGACAGAAAVAVLVYLQVRGYRGAEGTHQLPVFPLSVAIVGLYLTVVIAFLVPERGVRRLVDDVRRALSWRILLAVAVVVGVRIGADLIARRAGFDQFAQLKDAVWSSTLDPGLFLVVLVGYYGPLLLVLLADLPRVATDAWRFGPGMVAILAFALLGAINEQPRWIIDAFPFLVLLGVLAARRLYRLSPPVLLAFLGLSVLLARPWLPIGSIPTDLSRLPRFPAQLYYMATGTWTSPVTYWIQLAGVALVALALCWMATAWPAASSGSTAAAAAPDARSAAASDARA